jgi:hypothetical protein
MIGGPKPNDLPCRIKEHRVGEEPGILPRTEQFDPDRDFDRCFRTVFPTTIDGNDALE